MRIVLTLIYFLITSTCLFAQVTYTAVITNESCRAFNGEIQLSASGGDGGPYIYSINNGNNFQADSNFRTLSSDFYQIVIQDGSGNEVKGIEVVGGSDGPNITFSEDRPISCSDSCDGRITASVSGGNPPYTYVWRNSNGDTLGSDSAEITNLCAGEYFLSVTDQTLAIVPIYFESFGFDNNCSNRNQLATNATLAGGSWTQTITAAEGSAPNLWFISATESFTGAGNCSAGCDDSMGPSNQTLHVSAPAGTLDCFLGDCGTIYSQDANSETHKRIESPTIDLTGKSNIKIAFDYMGYGEGADDFCTLDFFNGSNWGVVQVGFETNCCIDSCNSVAAIPKWAPIRYETDLPGDNIPNFRIGFSWHNDADGSGSDPSFAVDNIVVGPEEPIGCVNTKGITINQPDSITFMSSFESERCTNMDGSISFFNFSGGNAGAYEFSIDNGNNFQADSNFINLNAQLYDLVVIDGNGCVSYDTLRVTSVGTPIITATCRDTSLYVDEFGMANILPPDIVGPASGGCTDLIYSLIDTFFTCNNTSTLINSLIVSDSFGNADTCIFTVTLIDTFNPVAICKDISITLDSNGSASVDSTDVNNGSNDNCFVKSISLSKSEFNCADTGDNIIIVTVTDASGNTDECTSIVTVNNNKTVTAICQDVIIYLDNNGQANVTTTEIDNGSQTACNPVQLALDKTTFTCNDIGDNILTLTVSYDTNSATCQATVTVLDTTPPVLICEGDTTIGESENPYEYPLPIATDNCATTTVTLVDGLGPNSFFPIGTNIEIYEAADGSGNTDNCSIVVIVKSESTDDDIIDNLFTPNGDGVNDFWVLPDNGKYDNCQLTITSRTGLVVYESSSYQNDWDGTYQGKPVLEATYYYLLKCNENIQTGAINVIRLNK